MNEMAGFAVFVVMAAIFSFGWSQNLPMTSVTRNLSRRSHHAAITDPDTGALVNVEVTDWVTWSQLAEPGEPVPTATWRSISDPPQQAAPARFLPEPSPLFLGPFQNASDILLALPPDAAYLVHDYRLEFSELSAEQWIGSVTLLVGQMHGSIRITFPFRAVDEAGLARAGTLLSYAHVRDLISAAIAAGKNVTVTGEPNDLYRQATQQRAEMAARMPIGGLRFESVEQESVQHFVQQLAAQEEHAFLYGTATEAPRPHQPGPQQKAEKLLKSWLSEAQLARYEKKGWFEVVGNVTGQRYRIHRGITSNIELIDAAGKRTGRICVVPKGLSALGDVMLAQKVALETDELGALKLANPDGGEGACFLVMVAKHGHKYAEHIKRISQTIGQP
jgi:hypothetical protein